MFVAPCRLKITSSQLPRSLMQPYDCGIMNNKRVMVYVCQHHCLLLVCLENKGMCFWGRA